jgi:hypothetical protein
MTKTQKLLCAAAFATAATLSSTFAMAETPLQMARAECRANGANSADCQCLDALRKGTVDALKDFKFRYSGAQTICNTQAYTNFGEDVNGSGESSAKSTNSAVPPRSVQ